MAKPPQGCIEVRLIGDPPADADAIADALARCDAVNLFCIDGRGV
jgi:hypothetical protein